MSSQQTMFENDPFKVKSQANSKKKLLMFLFYFILIFGIITFNMHFATDTNLKINS